MTAGPPDSPEHRPAVRHSTSTELSVCRQPGPADVSPRQLSSLPYFSLVDSFSALCTGSDLWPSPPSRFPPLLSATRWPLPPTLRSPIQPIDPFRHCTVYRTGPDLRDAPLPKFRLEFLPIDGCLYDSKF